MNARLRLLLSLAFTFPFAAADAAAHDFRYGEPPQSQRPMADYVPELAKLADSQRSELRATIEHFMADRGSLTKFYSVNGSTLQLTRLREFYEAWQQKLEAMPYDSVGVEGRIDWHLLRLQLRYELGLVERQMKRNAEMAPLLPFADAVARLQEQRQILEPVPSQEAATMLAQIKSDISAARKNLEGESAKDVSKIVALRAANRTGELNRSLKNWFDHYNSYDPLFGWWNRVPYKEASEAIEGYAKFLREKVVGVKPGEDEPIVGDPIGPEGLQFDLEKEMIPYSPQELIAIAEKEFAWCEAEWRKVAREMGLGDDWRAALEKVKQDHVAPGEQPGLIADMAYEAVRFIKDRDILTIPPLAIDDWRMIMMSPERQKVSPFFLGGEMIIVSFPTDTMDHAEKLDSLRANNRHFARAVVHHELIPGHHLQDWYMDRFNTHRRLFYTPFWIEGWALWWEFHLWNLGFAQTPEQRAGMLFWRTHRAARIVFSLNFHLGQWTPQECIDFLVERVGHDRHTATGEVRRSFNGDYSPLYQVAYMMGAIQLRSLYAEVVTSGRMGEKEFHDRVMLGGTMPIEMVRAHITDQKLPRDHRTSWKFAGDKP
jgi:uncharacterized protein (DUF885 family)